MPRTILTHLVEIRLWGKDEILHGACPEAKSEILHSVQDDSAEGFRMTVSANIFDAMYNYILSDANLE